MKSEKGITLIILIITLIIMGIITTTVAINYSSLVESNKYFDLKNDIEKLNTAVEKYYTENDTLPILSEEYTNVNMLNDIKNPNDNDKYYVINLDLLVNDSNQRIELKNGVKGFEKIRDNNGTSNEVYIINEQSRTIYYPAGIKYDGNIYYSLNTEYTQILDLDLIKSIKMYSNNNLIEYAAIGDTITLEIRLRRNLQDESNLAATIMGETANISKDGKTYKITYTITGQENALIENQIENGDSIPFSVSGIQTLDITTLTNGNINVIYNSNLFSNSSWNSIKGVNIPKLENGMVPVKYDNEYWIICNSSDNDWYCYTAQIGTTDNGSSKWANVMLMDGLEVYNNGTEGDSTIVTNSNLNSLIGKKVKTMGSMYVWIPRYAYKIESGWHSNTAGTISIVFLSGTSSTKSGINIDTYANAINEVNSGEGMKNYVVHPAFTNKTMEGLEAINDPGNIEGIWMAKFEASSSNPSTINGGNNVTNLNVRSIANVPSWRGIDITNVSTNCNRIGRDNYAIYGFESNTTINSHMMLNSEWGAAAYLAWSNYGRNAHEVWINNSNSYITGSCSTAGKSDSNYNGTTTTTDYKVGINASTTNNVYGIYDMSGGAWEYVATYYNSTNLEINIVEKYTSKYPISIYGDAVYETSSDLTGITSWNSGYSYFPNSGDFIKCGGSFNNGINTGLFCFHRSNIANVYYGFRPVLIIK